MLTPREVERIATKINKEVNLPFLNELKEQKLFVKLIGWVDEKIYTVLPNEYYEMVRYVEDGISLSEAESIKVTLTDKINKAIDLPILPERTEGYLFGKIIGLIVDAMVVNSDMNLVTTV
jgi:hypothetical protein